MQNRDGELGPHPFRTDRIYHLDERWFIAVRNNDVLGPFDSREQAALKLDAFLSELQS